MHVFLRAPWEVWQPQLCKMRCKAWWIAHYRWNVAGHVNQTLSVLTTCIPYLLLIRSTCKFPSNKHLISPTKERKKVRLWFSTSPAVCEAIKRKFYYWLMFVWTFREKVMFISSIDYSLRWLKHAGIFHGTGINRCKIERYSYWFFVPLKTNYVDSDEAIMPMIRMPVGSICYLI